MMTIFSDVTAYRGEDKSPGHGMDLKIGIFIFGGVGLLMLIVGLVLLVGGDVMAAVGLSVFGLAFCAGAYGIWRVFAKPERMREGMKKVPLGEIKRANQGELGQSKKLTGAAYMYVDPATPEAEIERMQKEWSETPWTQRSDWAEGKVVEEGISNIRFLAIFTILLNVITGIALWIWWDSSNVPWLALFFQAFGVVLVVATVLTWMHKRKFGISVLHFKTVPFYLGDRLQGTIQTGIPLKNQVRKDFSVRLTCVRRTTTRYRDHDKSVSEERLWNHEETIQGDFSDAGPVFQVSVDIAVPEGLPPTELYPKDDRTLWRLAISSKEKGLDYNAQFEVPIYSRSRAN